RANSQERFERYRQAVTVAEELAGLRTTHPSTNPLPVLQQVGNRLRILDAKGTDLTAALAGEIEVSFEVPPPPSWQPVRRAGIVLLVLGLLVSPGSFALETAGVLDLGFLPILVGAVVAVIGVVLAFVASWLRR